MDARARIAAIVIAVSSALIPPGRAGAGEHPHSASTEHTPRARNPSVQAFCVSRLAIPSYDEHYTGGYVGGGRAIGGQARCPNEGTYGWDYSLFRASGRGSFLGWSHGRRSQGGTGSYATDGPHPLRSLGEHLGKD